MFINYRLTGAGRWALADAQVRRKPAKDALGDGAVEALEDLGQGIRQWVREQLRHQAGGHRQFPFSDGLERRRRESGTAPRRLRLIGTVYSALMIEPLHRASGTDSDWILVQVLTQQIAVPTIAGIGGLIVLASVYSYSFLRGCPRGMPPRS